VLAAPLESAAQVEIRSSGARLLQPQLFTPRAEAVVERMQEAGFAEACAVPLHGGITTIFVGRK